MEIIEGISFEPLAGHKQFLQSKVVPILIALLIKNKDNFALQMLTIKILKYDIVKIEENQKEAARILEESRLIEFFYPNLKR